MRITDFARRLGVSVDTVRRLERQRILSPLRDWAGHRRYSQTDLERAEHHIFRTWAIARRASERRRDSVQGGGSDVEGRDRGL